MPKILLICKSTTGFTRRYADWIAAETGCHVIDFRAANPKTLAGFDTILFGSRLFAGKIDGLDKIRPMIAASGARFILFATGATPNAAEDIINAMWRTNLSPDELRTVPHFYMQAGMNFAKMPFIERMMMKLATLIMARKKEKTAEEQGFADALSRSFDITSPEYARPLIDHIRNEVRS